MNLVIINILITKKLRKDRYTEMVIKKTMASKIRIE